jgi:hypothetical protein
VRHAMIALLISATRVPVFVHRRRQAVTLLDATAPNYFAGEVIRPSAR